MSARPTLTELRAVSQPDSVVGRVSGEHWAGRLYMRHLSIHVTRLLVPTPVTPNAVTWSMMLAGVGAAVVLTAPHVWAAVLAVVLVQLQGLLDCTDGELARWRGRSDPVGIYLDRLGHYVTDAGLAVAVGVQAQGGLGNLGGWTVIGLCCGFLVLLTKAETDLVHVARSQAKLPPVADVADVAAPRAAGLRRLRSLATAIPFNRALLAIEMSVLALVASIIDATRGDLAAVRVLDVTLLVVAGIVVVGHLLAVVSSARLR